MKPKTLFLIDGIGAMVTAGLLAGVVAQFESIFGVPLGVLYILAAIAVVFAIYSLTCYFKAPIHWPPFLQAIAIANLSYCILTLILMVAFRNEVTTLGIAYFIGEILVVSVLAIYEFISARRGSDPKRP